MSRSPLFYKITYAYSHTPFTYIRSNDADYVDDIAISREYMPRAGGYEAAYTGGLMRHLAFLSPAFSRIHADSGCRLMPLPQSAGSAMPGSFQSRLFYAIIFDFGQSGAHVAAWATKSHSEYALLGLLRGEDEVTMPSTAPLLPNFTLCLLITGVRRH